MSSLAQRLLHSRYVIDGVMQDLTPAQMLREYLLSPSSDDCPPSGGWQFADETVDPSPLSPDCDIRMVEEYLDAIRGREEAFPTAFAAQYAKICIARALTDMLWREGRFHLRDVVIDLHWRWNADVMGNAAAFYASVQAACEYVDALGIRVSGYGCVESSDCALTVSASAVPEEDGEEAFVGNGRACPATMVPDPESWIIYAPIDDGAYRLGGSLLSQVLGKGDAVAPELYAPDYLMDCHELLREMVEDGILLSARTVGAGGLISAVDALSGGGAANINIGGLMKAMHEDDAVRVLFSEVPGVVFQISDEDFDYVDAEFTLQEVMFFPLGHPELDGRGVSVEVTDRDSIRGILESLMRGRPSA